MRILVVDDMLLVLKAVERLVRGIFLDHDVIARGQPQLAAQLRDIDIVVTDFEMPAMDGLELLRRLRKHNPNMVGIIFTCSPWMAQRDPGRGVADHIIDKIDPRALLGVLRAEKERHARNQHRAEGGGRPGEPGGHSGGGD